MDSTPAHAPIVLHGAWVPAAGGASGALLLWGERLAHYAGEDSADGSPAPHPFAAGEADLRATLTALGGADTPAAWFPAMCQAICLDHFGSNMASMVNDKPASRWSESRFPSGD